MAWSEIITFTFVAALLVASPGPQWRPHRQNRADIWQGRRLCQRAGLHHCLLSSRHPICFGHIDHFGSIRDGVHAR